MGLSNEQKQDLSLELNLHRRQLTKEQKKEIAANLREQGWTRERIGDNVIDPAELPTTETPRQNWAETIQEVIQQEQEKAERRLAEERAGMEAAIRERVASVEQHYREQASQTIAERSGPGHEMQQKPLSSWDGLCLT